MVCAACAAVVGAGILFSGCEVESVTASDVFIDPPAATLEIGQSREFVASGGYYYTWSLEHEEWGTLSERTGNRVVYTSRYDPGGETYYEEQILRVISSLEPGGGSGGTNGMLQTQTAEARITHKSVQETIAIDPASGSVKKWESISFTASGANTYAWSLEHEDWGVLNTRNGAKVTYTSTYRPDVEEALQILTVASDRGTVSAHIIHELEPLTITPTSAFLTFEQSVTATFKATGGDNYTWNFTGSGVDNINYSVSGDSATVIFINVDDISPGDSATVVVTVTSGGRSAQALVTLYNPI